MNVDNEFVLCAYTAKPGHEAQLEELLRQHWPTLHRLGLATDTPAVLARGQSDQAGAHDAGGKYLEIFSWKDAQSMKLAHESPDVLRIWEGIGACTSFMDFPGYAVFE